MSSCRHLTASEQVLIDRLRFREHRSIRQIAEVIGRSPSTVSRELRRNLWNPSNENESYRPYRPARLKTGAWTGGPYYCALPPAARISRTWDNGSEFALQLLVDESTDKPTYYADLYSSYQRGGNENRNGIIRRHLPKGTSLDDLTQDELYQITRRIDNTPLKILGWLTPAEAWDEQMERLAAQGTPVPGHTVQSTPTHNPRQCCTSN